MKRKEVVLFMTVGTGINTDLNETGFQALSKKMYSTIIRIYPNYVVFFASEKSRQTIKYIEELFKSDNDEFVEGEDYQIVPMEAIDNFNSCFEIIESKIWEFDLEDDGEYKIIMDYTSGTKTMSAAMAGCGLFYSKELISVGGDRTTGEVSIGTEKINYQNPYKIYDKLSLMRFRFNFNSYRFNVCIGIVKNIIDLHINKDPLLHLSCGYGAWDNMDFEHAYSHLKQVGINQAEFSDIKPQLSKNLKALGTIINSKSDNLKNCYILASLINNSIRRAEDFHFDDAIARLYRAFELIAQIRLTSYGIKSSDVDVSILLDNGVDKDFIDELEKTRDDGKIKTGLIMDYTLLVKLDDELGRHYLENEKKIKNTTLKRNNSILAHGLESSTKEDFDKFLEIVLDMARKVDKGMNKFINETKFAQFDLKYKFRDME